MSYKIPENIRWVWFDLDDTLYDFASSSLTALGKIYRQYHLDRFFPDEQTWIDSYHEVNHKLWELYNAARIGQMELRRRRFEEPLASAGASQEVISAMLWDMDRDYLDYLAATGTTIDGANELLERLKADGYKIGILSNGFKGVQHAKLASSRLAPMIDCVVLSDEASFNKPDPRIFLFALEKSGATPQNSLMVGDNPDTDIAGALSAGWNVLLFNPSAPPHAEILSSEPYPVVSSLRQIIGAS